MLVIGKEVNATRIDRAGLLLYKSTFVMEKNPCHIKERYSKSLQYFSLF